MITDAVRETTAEGARSTSRSILVMGAFEGRRVLKSPIFSGGVVASLAIPVLFVRTQSPVLHRDDIFVGAALLPLALSTLLVLNLVVIRHRRFQATEIIDAAPLSTVELTLAHLTAAAWAVGASILVTGAVLLILLFFDPVGSPRMAELAVGPLVVALAGVAGIALAKWIPSSGAGPIAAVGLAALQLYSSTGLTDVLSRQSRTRWLAPWVNLSNAGTPDSELTIRPSAWHAVYLVGVILLVSTLAVSRHLRRPRTIAVGLLALAVTIVGAGMQLRSPSRDALERLADLVTRPALHQSCEERAQVRYCAFPGYEGWIDRWESVVTSVLGPVPVGIRPASLELRQVLLQTAGSDLVGESAERLDTNNNLLDNDRIYLGTRWGRGRSEVDYVLAIALPAAERAVGLRHEIRLAISDIDALTESYPLEERLAFRETLTVGQSWPSCHTVNQARAVVALWLAFRVDPRATSVLAEIARSPLVTRDSASGEVQYSGPLIAGGEAPFARPDGYASPEFGRTEAAYALQLLELPDAEVSRVLARNWTRLTHPSTPTAEVTNLFTVRPLPPLNEALVKAGMPRSAAQGIRDEDFVNTVPC